jgi:hypothetical protein
MRRRIREASSRRRAVAVALLAGLVATGSLAAEDDGGDRRRPEPAGICADAGLARDALAICRVYCEVLECDVLEAPEGRPGQACERLGALFERRVGSPLPCEDADLDGVADELDNCPFDPNPLQEDADGDGAGDVCDPCPDDYGETCDCPCFTAVDLRELLAEPVCAESALCLELRPGNILAKTFLQCPATSPEVVAFAGRFQDDLPECSLETPAGSVRIRDLGQSALATCSANILGASEAEGLICE